MTLSLKLLEEKKVNKRLLLSLIWNLRHKCKFQKVSKKEIDILEEYKFDN